MTDISEEIAALRERAHTVEPDDSGSGTDLLVKVLLDRFDALWDAVEVLASEVARQQR